MKKLVFFLILPVLALLGAGCGAGPQAAIADPRVGKAAAPVQISEYFDFQCPSCKEAESAVIPFIIEDYVNTGKAALTFKVFSFIGSESNAAAMAAFCAEEQGKFLDYGKKVFEAQGAENSGVFTSAKLKNIAGEVGLNTATFNACFDGKKYRDQVARESKEAASAGIDSTPTFVINGQKVPGGTYISIKRVIDNKLEEAAKK